MEQRPTDDPFSVKPIASYADTTDSEMIRSEIERMVMPTRSVCRARAWAPSSQSCLSADLEVRAPNIMAPA
jgi:hypothetical protein